MVFKNVCMTTWWRHQMETFSVLLAFCAGNSLVPGEFPSQRPVTQSVGVFFDLRLNKRWSKQSRCWWFETPLGSLWRHCNGKIIKWICICALHCSLLSSCISKEILFDEHNTVTSKHNSSRILFNLCPRKKCPHTEFNLKRGIYSDEPIPILSPRIYTSFCSSTPVQSHQIAHPCCLCAHAFMSDVVTKRRNGTSTAQVRFKELLTYHYGDIIMGTWPAHQIIIPPLFTQPFSQAQIKENIKAPRHWLLCGEFTVHRWIPRANG